MRTDTLADLHRRNAALHGTRAALLQGAQRIEHAALLRAAEGLAQTWADAGVARGDRVALLARNRPGLCIAYAACELAGFVAVGLNHRLAPAELAAICADCEPSLLLHEARLRTAAEVCIGAARRWSIDEPAFDAACARPAGPATTPGTVTPGDLACLLYTSGSTGRPKGVMLSHGALMATARGIALETGARADDVFAAAMPLFHIGARCKTLGYAWRGAASWLVEQFEPEAFIDGSVAVGATAWHLAPSMVQSVVGALEQRPHALPTLRALHYAAAPMPLPLLRAALRHFGPVLRQFYGMTESGAAGTVLHPWDHDPGGDGRDARLRSAGQAGAEVELRIVGPDGGALPTGAAGEVELRSAACMSGYWRNPEATAQALHDGWLRTGDIGRLDGAGYLTLLDRKKDMIVSGGENIVPREVEDALLAHPSVVEAAVIGVPDAHWGESVLAFVVAGTPPPTEAALIEHVRQCIASYKKPRRIELVDALPKLATGKVDKKALRAPFWADSERAI